jgi:hypothetical protein
MKYLSSFFIILFCLSLTGCKDSGTQVQGTGTPTYPSSLNNEWEYQTVTTIGFYNQSGGIDSTHDEEFYNSIIKIMNTNDSLKNYKGLIKFEIYDKPTPDLKCNYWYLNSDTSFIAIAYYNPIATQFIQPKRNFTRKYLTLADIKNMIHSFSPNLSSGKINGNDSILYYDVPRKVLSYPLSVGNRWVELYYPFYRERYINNYLSITAGNRQYYCYEIKVKWQDYKIQINDYINTDAGLVKRDIIADSIQIATEEHPEGIGFGKIKTTSTLVRRNY